MIFDLASIQIQILVNQWHDWCDSSCLGSQAVWVYRGYVSCTIGFAKFDWCGGAQSMSPWVESLNGQVSRSKRVSKVELSFRARLQTTPADSGTFLLASDKECWRHAHEQGLPSRATGRPRTRWDHERDCLVQHGLGFFLRFRPLFLALNRTVFSATKNR